jgi:hypothetical protein
VRKTYVEAMSSLSRANPLEESLGWWTPSDEDAMLAAVFAAASEEAAPGAAASVPSIPPRRPKRAALIGVCVAAVGVVALAVDLIGSGSPSALAAWTTTTTTPPASQLRAAQSACERFYGRGNRLLPPEISEQLPGSLPPLAMIDSRGPFEMLVYAGTTGEAVCLWDSSGVIGVSAGISSGNAGTLPPTSDHSIGVPRVGFDRLRRSALTYAYGHAGTSVSGITLNLVDGVRVQATVENGFYAAWWPSKTDVTAATVTTSQGAYRQDFGDIGPNDNGPPEPGPSDAGP